MITKTAEKSITLTNQSGEKEKVSKEYSYTFGSLSEFLTYIKTTPRSSAAEETHSQYSKSNSKSFTGTSSLDEALSLMESGWEEGAQKIEKGLKEVLKNNSSTATRQRSVYDVIGGNASVPRYLQGVPTNMIRQVRQPVKQPIADVYINLSFACGISQEEIISTCIKTLQQVVNLENAGTRVNLYLNTVVTDTKAPQGMAYQVKVCLKKSTERLNVLKLAFPSAHPSMLRRIMFAFYEHCPDIQASFFPGYGHPAPGETNRENFTKAFEV